MTQAPKRPSVRKIHGVKSMKPTSEQIAYADKVSAMADDDVFASMKAIEDRQKSIIEEGGSWEDEGLLWKSNLTEIEIIKRNPGQMMQAYITWLKGKSEQDMPEQE